MATKPILILDDDEAILEAMRVILEQNNFQVITSTAPINPEEIVRLEPALIFVDLRMPQMDGTSFIATLKQNDATKTIPIILSSAVNDLENLAQQAKADDVLAKPFDLTTLLDKVSQHLQP